MLVKVMKTDYYLIGLVPELQSFYGEDIELTEDEHDMVKQAFIGLADAQDLLASKLRSK